MSEELLNVSLDNIGAELAADGEWTAHLVMASSLHGILCP
jgi:hypothetical protein